VFNTASVAPPHHDGPARGPALARDVDEVIAALDQRLHVAASVLAPELSLTVDRIPSAGTLTLLTNLLRRCHGDANHRTLWMVLTALRGAFPGCAAVESATHLVASETADAVARTLLAEALRDGSLNRFAPYMDLVRRGVLLNVDFCARNATHGGIQHLVRELTPRWVRTHNVQLAVWTANFETMRAPEQCERDRVLLLPEDGGNTTPSDRNDDAVDHLRIVVPWGVPVVLPDVPSAEAADVLAAMGQYSPNDLVIVGYDLTPVIDADTRPAAETEGMVRWLRAVKHARLVAAISDSAKAEFTGFAEMMAAQGLSGPEVVSVIIAETPVSRRQYPKNEGRPVVVIPGRREPHKNQRIALHAAEVLWRRGLDFEVRMIGGPGWTPGTVEGAITRLQTEGWPLTVLGWVDDDTQWDEFAHADIAVFASLHEGYGLSVTECLAFGVPTITTAYGSQAEIAAEGGCVVVDPRDDSAIVEALSTLLTDTGRRDALRAEALARNHRTWSEYADELWAAVMRLGTSS